MARQPWRGSSMRAYVWDRCLLLQAGTLVVDRRARPYKRLSATIVVAIGRPFVLELDGEAAREYRGILIAPNVLRRYIEAVESDVTFLDAGITSRAYRDLAPHLARDRLRSLTDDELGRMVPRLRDGFAAAMDCAAAMRLFDDVVRAISPASAPDIARDARVARVMELVEASSFSGVSVGALAREVGLSESRLRDLFRRDLGCRLSQYMRWVAAWKAVGLWQQGMKFTDVAHAVGFHDLAHADHAFTEIFGLSPSEVTDPRRIALHKCGA